MATAMPVVVPDMPKRSLVKKLAEVMAAVGWIEKTGFNEFHRYKYAQEADLVQALRGELAKRHLFVFPNVKECKRSEHTVESSRGIRKTQLTEIAVEWTFVDGESGEERTITVHGVGEDNVDKGFYKAFTGSEKYMLMKSFLIPTGDDPERDSKEEAKEAKERGKADAKAVGEAKAKKMAGKGQESQQRDVTCVFYTMPERFNGHFAEFINLKEFGAAQNEVAQEGLRMMMKKYVSKVTEAGTCLVAVEKLEPFLLEFKDCQIDTKQLKAAD